MTLQIQLMYGATLLPENEVTQSTSAVEPFVYFQFVTSLIAFHRPEMDIRTWPLQARVGDGGGILGSCTTDL